MRSLGFPHRNGGDSEWGPDAPEVRLIKRAVRVGPPGVSSPAADSDRAGVDWPALVALARVHGVLALVARSLKGEGWVGVPDEVVQTLVEYRASLTARNLLLTRRLLDILDLLAGHGIPALPYKGPVLAAYAYDDIGMRPCSDLDLIVAEADVLRARALLLAQGYRSLSPRTDAERPDTLPPGYALALRGDDDVVVELHWRLAPSFPLTIEGLLPGAAPYPLLDSTVPSLSPEHLLLVLCVHGGKHAWERLQWVCDVAHVVARQPATDWDRLAAEARALGAQRSVALGLALATDLAGAPVPRAAMRATGADRARSLAAVMETALLRHAPGSMPPVRRHALRFRAASAADRARYLLHLRHPTEKDRAFVSLPSGLSSLYVVVRPLRVLSQQVSGRQQPARDSAARRALTRQLAHQQQKAAALTGRDDEVMQALAIRWERVRRRLMRWRPEWGDPRMLEVGSAAHGIVFGSGSTRAVGVDPLAVDYARLFPAWQRRVPTLAAVGERLPFPDGAFDIVLCDNVVDHCEGPAAIMAEMTRLLSPGGMLFFTVNVHHRLYSMVGRAHRAWTAAGIPVVIGPFADHTVHLTPDGARALFAGLPLDIRRERVSIAEAKERARRRPLRRPGHLVPLVFFKNARFEVIAERR